MSFLFEFILSKDVAVIYSTIIWCIVLIWFVKDKRHSENSFANIEPIELIEEFDEDLTTPTIEE